MTDFGKLIDYLKQTLPQLELVYLFGSQARGDANPESDFDIAIQAQSALQPIERLDLEGALSTFLRKEVDLVDLSTASDVLKVQVIGDGKLLYARDATQQAEFEMYALSDYAHLNERRHEILKDFYNKDPKNGR